MKVARRRNPPVEFFPHPHGSVSPQLSLVKSTIRFIGFGVGAGTGVEVGDGEAVGVSVAVFKAGGDILARATPEPWWSAEHPARHSAMPTMQLISRLGTRPAALLMQSDRDERDAMHWNADLLGCIGLSPYGDEHRARDPCQGKSPHCDVEEDRAVGRPLETTLTRHRRAAKLWSPN